MRAARFVVVTALLVAALTAQERAPLNRAEIYRLKTAGVSEQRIMKLVTENGINFEPVEENLQALKHAGATTVLLDFLRKSRLKAHIDSAKKLDMENRYSEAEQEWRLAIALTPADNALHLHLGDSLLAAGRAEEAIAELERAAATEPEAEDHLKSAREAAEQKRREAKAAEQQRSQEEQSKVEAARQLEYHRAGGLAGRWKNADSGVIYQMTVNQSDFEARSQNGWVFRGTISGGSITGTLIRPTGHDTKSNCDWPSASGDWAGTISANGDSIVVKAQLPYYNFTYQNTFGGARCGLATFGGYTPDTFKWVRSTD